MAFTVDDLLSDVSSADADDGYVDMRAAASREYVDVHGAAENGYLETEDDGYDHDAEAPGAFVGGDLSDDGYAAAGPTFEDLMGYDHDTEAPGAFVGGDPAEANDGYLDGYLDDELGFGPVGDDVGADSVTIDSIFGFVNEDGYLDYGGDSKVSAAGQAAIKAESAALKEKTGKEPMLITVLNALLQSGGISQADASEAAKEHGESSGGLFSNIVKDVGTAASSLAKGAVQAAGAVAKGVGEEVSTAVTTVEDEAKTVGSTIGNVATDVSKGNFGGALGAISAGAKAVAKEAESGVEDELTHIKATAQSAAKDLLNGVKGAEKALLALVSQFSPNDIIEMIESDFTAIRNIFDGFVGGQKVSGADAKKPAKPDPNAIDLSQYTIPTSGAIASLFPKQYRGTTVRWSDARKNAGTILWYLCGLALVDALHLRNQILHVFGIKSLDGVHAADGEVYGFAPLAAIAGNIPTVIMILIAVFVIATVVVATVAGPKTVLGKLASKIENNPLFQAGAKALGLGGLLPGQPTINGIAPATAPAGQPVNVVISGAGFASGTTVTVNGTAVPTQVASPTQLTAQFPGLPVGSPVLTVTSPGAPAVNLPPGTFVYAAPRVGATGVAVASIGHSSPIITYAVIGVAAVLLILFIKSRRDAVT